MSKLTLTANICDNHYDGTYISLVLSTKGGKFHLCKDSAGEESEDDKEIRQIEYCDEYYECECYKSDLDQINYILKRGAKISNLFNANFVVGKKLETYIKNLNKWIKKYKNEDAKQKGKDSE